MHLSASLDVLVNTLIIKDTDINSIKNKFSSLFCFFHEKYALRILRKGVYPYDYMDKDWENKLKEKELPSNKYFNSTLTNTKCSQEDYEYAQKNFKYFKCKNIEDYNNIYVQSDVLLLAASITAYRAKGYNSF